MGLAAGEALVELGADVALLDVDSAGLKERATTLGQIREGSAWGLACNLQDEQEARKAVRLAVEKMGGLDILVHSAALVGSSDLKGWAVSFDQQGVEAWSHALDVNLTAAFVLAQEARQALATSGKGSIIFLGSIYGVVGPDPTLYEGTGMYNPAAYNASKGGLLQLARYLATVLAPSIRVNSISPGGIWRNQPDDFIKKYVNRTPLKRMAREEDMKGAIAFLASDLSAYVTGQNLLVDGGWTIW